METKFTPGPWRFLDDEVIEDTEGYIITSLKCDSRFSLDTILANVKLIVTAPELLEALEDLIQNVESLHEISELPIMSMLISKGKEIIKKATS